MAPEINKSLLGVAKGAGIIFLGAIIDNLLGISNQFLLGRFLGPESYGLFNLGVSIIMVLAVLPRFGLGQALIQFIPYNLSKREYGKVKIGIQFSLKFCLIVGVLVSGILFIFSEIIATKIFHNTELGIVIKVSSIGVVFLAFRDTAGSLMQAFRKPKCYVYVENIYMKILQLIIFLISIFLGYRLFGALIAFVCAAIFACVAYAYILYSKLYPSLNISSISNHQEKEPVEKELIYLAWPLFLSGFVFLFSGYTDKILLGIYTTSEDVGIYSAAFTLANMMLVIYMAFSYNFRPLVAEFFAARDVSSIQRIFSSVAKWIFIITFPLIIYIVFYSREFIFLIYGESFTKGSPVLIILSIGLAMNGLTGMTGEILVAIKKTRLNLFANIIGAVSNIILNIILIPKYGIIGAAIGTSVGIFLLNIFSLGFVYRELKIHPYNIDFIKIIVASLPFISFLLIFKIYLGSFVALIIGFPISLLIYTIFLLITHSFDEFDKSIIKTIFKKIGI